MRINTWRKGNQEIDQDIVIKGTESANGTVLIGANPKHRTHHHHLIPTKPPDMKPQLWSSPEMFSLPTAFSTLTSSFFPQKTVLSLQMIHPVAQKLLKPFMYVGTTLL